MSRVLSIALGIALLASPYQVAAAEETPLPEGLVRVDGLTFRCPGCSRLDSVSCVVPKDGEETLVACDEAIEFLLRRLLEGGYDRLHPGAMELRSYLLNEGLAYHRSRAAFELLFKAKGGEREIIRHARNLYGLHSEVLEELVNEGIASEKVLEHLWSLPTRSGRQSARLRTVIANAHPSYGIEKLFDSLTVIDLSADEQDLSVMADLLRLLGSSWAAQVELASSAFSSCAVPIDAATCDLTEVESKSTIAARYFERVRTQLTLRQLSERETAPGVVLDTVARLPYQRVRTPDMLELVVAAVIQLESDTAYWQSAPETVLGMLADVGQHDDQLASLLYTLVQDEGVRKSVARAGMSGAFEVYREEASGLYARGRMRTGSSKDASFELPLMVSAIAVFSILFFYLYQRFSLVRTEASSEHPLSAEERAELRALRKYFKIAPGAKQAELTKRFRVLARRFHPDVDGGSNRAFAELGEKYNRTKLLLQRLHTK